MLAGGHGIERAHSVADRFVYGQLNLSALPGAPQVDAVSNIAVSAFRKFCRRATNDAALM